MIYRKFGNLGWLVSEIGFGGWAIGGDMMGPQKDADSISALNKAIDIGVNLIDTAQGYGKGHSEELIGKVCKERKEELFIATKVPPIDGSPWPPPENYNSIKSFPAKYIIDSCEKSLRRLKRDYIDIYQFHTWAAAFNKQTQWFEAMENLKKQGKIRAIGVSVHDTSPDSVIVSLILDKVDVVQVIFNIFEQYPEFNLFPVCKNLGKAIIVRVPFDEGALTGKFNIGMKFPDGDVRQHYFRGNNLNSVIERVEKIRLFKNKNHPQMPMPEYALRFCLSNDAVGTVIPGIRNVIQAENNAQVSDGNYLSEAELFSMKDFYWRKDFWNQEIS